MTQESDSRMKPITLVLIIAGVITLLLGVLVGIAIVNQPRPITIEVTAPTGEAVVCDLVVDGQPETRNGVAPVRYVFEEAAHVDFAVIAVTASAGDVRVELTSGGGSGSAKGIGIRGSAYAGPAGSGISIGGMTREHVENMRAARAGESSAARAELGSATGSEHADKSSADAPR